MKIIEGISSSAGIARGKLFKYVDSEIVIPQKNISDNEVESEITKLEQNIKKSIEQIKKLKEENTLFDEEHVQLFDAHIEILNDIELIESAKTFIKENKFNVANAVDNAAKNIIQIFENLDDEYMRERAADIKDVTTRLIKNILNIETDANHKFTEEVILITDDLIPSQISKLDLNFVKGVAASKGNKNSHSSIIARTLEIPFVVTMGDELLELNDPNTNLILDATKGSLIIEPDSQTIKKYEDLIEEINKKKIILEEFKFKPTLTKDGKSTKIVANIGNVEDAKKAIKDGSEGIGLFRTEFLFMESKNWPTEEEQFNVYKSILEINKGKPVVIRMLDIGADKTLNYYEFEKEENPFLGKRGVRLLLDKREILTTQVRALLKATAYGELSINIPMVSLIEEFLEVQKEFKLQEKKLTEEGFKIGKYELGILLEIPSVVEMIDKFVKYVDFFSVGTNDLIQYSYAVDRLSDNISYLYQPHHPAILRKLNKILEISHANNKWVAICGELASEVLLAPIFVGMGLDEFSMTSAKNAHIRYIVSQVDSNKAKELVKIVLDQETEQQVKEKINIFLQENNINI